MSPWSRALHDEEQRSEAFMNLLGWAESAYEMASKAVWAGPESGNLTPLQELNYYEMSRAIASLTRCIKGPEFAGEAEARVHVSSLWGDHHPRQAWGRLHHRASLRTDGFVTVRTD